MDERNGPAGPTVQRMAGGAICLIGLLLFGRPSSVAGQSGPIVGLDHIPVAVRDLEQASATYRALGFAIKPGRPHPNGIRNTHVKCPDGSGIELITAGSAADTLTRHYVDFLAQSDGPAFLAFHARNTDRLLAALRRGGYPFTHEGGLTQIQSPGLDYLFVVRDNRSPTDRPEHLAHANTASALIRVWIATDEAGELVRLLAALGASAETRTVRAPMPVRAHVVKVENGEIVILPASHQVARGRPIVGATFRVREVAAVARYLSAAGVSVLDESPGDRARRVVVPPAAAHGLWLEFTR
jgi:hypothetical protein